VNNIADEPGDANHSGEAPGDLSATDGAAREAGVVDPTVSKDMPHVVYAPLPGASTARQQRALRRVTRNRTVPTWAKKIPRVIFPIYGVMRRHDPNYEEHHERWEEQERRNYDEQEPG
jgi:hypothetical protein